MAKRKLLKEEKKTEKVRIWERKMEIGKKENRKKNSKKIQKGKWRETLKTVKKYRTKMGKRRLRKHDDEA